MNERDGKPPDLRWVCRLIGLLLVVGVVWGLLWYPIMAVALLGIGYAKAGDWLLFYFRLFCVLSLAWLVLVPIAALRLFRGETAWRGRGTKVLVWVAWGLAFFLNVIVPAYILWFFQLKSAAWACIPALSALLYVPIFIALLSLHLMARRIPADGSSGP